MVVSGSAGGAAEEALETPDFGYGDRIRETLPVRLPRPAQEEQIGMGQRRDLREDGMVFLYRQRVCPRIALLASSEQKTGETIRQRRLADAFRADEEPGVMHAVRFEGIHQGLLGPAVTEDLRNRPRVCKPVESVGFGYDGDVTHGSSRSTTASQTSSATELSACWASMTTQRSGASAAILRNPRRNAS